MELKEAIEIHKNLRCNCDMKGDRLKSYRSLIHFVNNNYNLNLRPSPCQCKVNSLRIKKIFFSGFNK